MKKIDLQMPCIIVFVIVVISVYPLFSQSDFRQQKYSSIDDKFEILFSCTPEISEEIRDSDFGKYKVMHYLCETQIGGEIVTVSRYPKSFFSISTTKSIIDGCIEGYKEVANIVSEDEIDIMDMYGKIVKSKIDELYQVSFISVSENRMYQVQLISISNFPSESDIDNFIGTFKIIN